MRIRQIIEADPRSVKKWKFQQQGDMNANYFSSPNIDTVTEKLPNLNQVKIYEKSII